MAITKSDVASAIARLRARNVHPSDDAIRHELGDTGSKATISKYRRELEAEQGGMAAEQLGSEIGRLVAQLADRLRAEADARISAAAEASDLVLTEQRALVATAQRDLAELRTAAAGLATELQAERAGHGQTKTELQQQSAAAGAATQRAADLELMLAQQQAHNKSLEEKHDQARAALEHYRESVKQQREADQRRHEQQIQTEQAERRQLQQELVVKQNEVTRLNGECASLATERNQALRLHRDALEEGRAQASRIEALLRDVGAGQAQLQDALAQTAKIRKEADTASAQLRTCSAALSGAEEQLAGLRKQVEDLNALQNQQEHSKDKQQGEAQQTRKNPAAGGN